MSKMSYLPSWLIQIVILQCLASSLAYQATKMFVKAEKLAFDTTGDEIWKWQGHNIRYIERGDVSKPALLLIHGFGASAYHWRFNVPELAKDYHVFAFDMLGFGLSSKPVQEYSAEVKIYPLPLLLPLLIPYPI